MRHFEKVGEEEGSVLNTASRRESGDFSMAAWLGVGMMVVVGVLNGVSAAPRGIGAGEMDGKKEFLNYLQQLLNYINSFFS